VLDQQPTNVNSEDSCKGRVAEAADFSVTPYLTPRIKESAYITTTTLGHEKGPVKATTTDLTVADGASKEDQFCWAGPTSGDYTVAAPAKVPGYRPEPLSNARLLLSLARCVAISLHLLARSFDEWLSGPPMTAQERARRSITASDRYWKHRLKL
jgi:hypothetical protein